MNIDRKIFLEIERKIIENQESQEKKKVIIIYGPRQSGKTTISKKIISHFSNLKSDYFNCDYLDVRENFSFKNISNLKKILKNLELIILDEAQRIENVGLTLKVLVDEFPSLQVIATGSSSFDLSNKIKEPLTGRKNEFLLLPFSYGEMYGEKNFLEQKRNLDFHLRFGSYPEIFGKSEKESEEFLREITGSYLFKDIFTFQNLKKPELLIKLLQLLAFQIGSEVSFHELAQKLGVDQTVIQKYIHLLEEAFIIFRLGAFKRNLRSEITKSRKIYFWDLGIRNALIRNFNIFNFRNDIGELWENFCISERMKMQNNKNIFSNSYFWRTYNQKEIDLIEERDGKIELFEFKWNSKKNIYCPKDFSDNYKNFNFNLVNPDNFDEFIL